MHEAFHKSVQVPLACPSQAVECLAALAETNAPNVRVLAKDGCVAALLSVIGHADAASKSARSGVVLLQYLAQHQASVRCVRRWCCQ